MGDMDAQASGIKRPTGNNNHKDSFEYVVIHLQMIQNIVDRMARCSFWIKGWAIAVVIALMAVIFRADANPYMYSLIIPVIGFGFLDGYYLWQERCFRGTYNNVRKQQETDFAMIPDMKYTYLGAVISKIIFWFYFTLCTLIILTVWSISKVSLVTFLLRIICNG